MAVLPPHGDVSTTSEALHVLLGEMDFAEAMRLAAGTFGYKVETVTVNGSGIGDLDLKASGIPNTQAELRMGTEFGRKALRLLREAATTYQERNAVYKDNFRVVGRVMAALFPNGAPALHDAADFNRWHIFELIIVKLTRYVANFEDPDRDSLVDMLPYLAILGAQDDELREVVEADAAHAEDIQSRVDSIMGHRTSRSQMRHEDRGPNYDAFENNQE